MAQNQDNPYTDMKKTLETIAIEDGRYSSEIIRFVYEGLAYTVKTLADEPGHVTGQLLCEGLRQLAMKKWGRLAKLVLETGGITKTNDFGQIVWLLIENKWMSAQPSDSIEDFDNIYDFDSFKSDFNPDPA